ncbi:hypothetical protein SUGI_1138150 [Cryptomeria japonica]|nr:hypothetical protein SUGI_1138150 [Cryptomeria japonica]
MAEGKLARAKAKKHDKLRYKMLCCFTRHFTSGPREPPQDVRTLYESYCGQGGSMTPEVLQRFLNDYGAVEKDAQRVMEMLRERGQLTFYHHHHLPLDAFFGYLFSDDLNPPVDKKIHHDMTAPLSHYFIFTGHNSYLTGNQLNSDCSDEPIIKALKRGVRGIELDIWPNSNKDDINVLHGRTLTAPVKFIKCIQSIKEHAFVASEYPVIITLEDHLTPELQDKLAKMMTETFGDMLFYPDPNDYKVLPSPEDLKHHIIISTKPPKEYLERQNSADLESGGNEGKNTGEEETWGDEIPDFENVEPDEKDAHGVGSAEEDLDDDNGVPREKIETPGYKQLIAIRGGKVKGLSLKDILRVDDDYVKRISLSLPKLKKLAKLHPDHIVRFTQKNILRIYPESTRVMSSNGNPFLGWTHGAQMVAFNMQGYGRNLWLAHGFFRANGECGYVKKPNILLLNANDNSDDCQDIFNPKNPRPVKTTLRVKVYMGDGWVQDFKKTHFDLYSPPDFYTRVGIAGVPADTVMKRTRAIEDNWIPCWGAEFSFPLTVPELALLRVEVHEYDMSEKDDFGGQTCLPVAELKTGIRAVPLFNKKGEKYQSVRLLMRFEFVPS